MNTNHILVAHIYLYKVELYHFENDGALAEFAYLLLLCLKSTICITNKPPSINIIIRNTLYAERLMVSSCSEIAGVREWHQWRENGVSQSVGDASDVTSRE